jgi:hypothetical protein
MPACTALRERSQAAGLRRGSTARECGAGAVLRAMATELSVDGRFVTARACQAGGRMLIDNFSWDPYHFGLPFLRSE